MVNYLVITRKWKTLAIICLLVGVLFVLRFYQKKRAANIARRYHYLDDQYAGNSKTTAEERNGLQSAILQESNTSRHLVSNNTGKSKEILQLNKSHIEESSRTSQDDLKRQTSGSPSVNEKKSTSKVKASSSLANRNSKSTTQNRTFHEYTLKFIDIERHVPDLDALFNRTVIVTAFSENHLVEAKGMIATAQQYMPHNKIIVYDLGLSSHGVKRVTQMCNVELRSFPFEKYPPHVKNIHTYAWKPLIILESLKEFGAIFYGDSSVRFLNSLRILYPHLKQNHGFMQHIHHFDPRSRDAQYHMTHPDTFKELGVNRTTYAEDIGFTPWISAGRVLHVNSSYIHEKVLGPLVECSLRQECISPKGARRGKGNNKGENHSHRFDSSVLALVVYKNMRGFYNDDNNSSDLFDKVVKIERKDFSVRGLKLAPHCHKMFY